MFHIPRMIGVIVLGVAAIACSPAQTSSDVIETKFETLADQYAENRAFNGTVMVARGGDILFEKSYGDAVLEWNIPVGPDTKYRIASLSKPFLATLVMRLVQDDALTLEDTLGQYFPDLYAETSVGGVTVAELLAHTSGMMDFPRDLLSPFYKSTARLKADPKSNMQEYIKPEFSSERGKWQYNNAGYILLGLIVEAATGEPFNDVMTEKVLAPAGMTSTAMFETNAMIGNLANAYVKSPEGDLIPAPFMDPSAFFTAAGLYSTADDMFKFDRALYTTDILSTESRSYMHTRKTDFDYGAGWGVQSWPLSEGGSVPVVHHTGSIPGYQSFYIRSEPNQDFVIVLNNTNNGSATVDLARDLMMMLNGEVIKRRLEDLVIPASNSGGVAAVIAAYEGLGDKKDDYDLSESRVNALGYKLKGMEKLDEAIAVFEWNVENHPESANPRDSLGEAYRAAGRIDEAIASYEAALDREPTSQSAKAAIADMRAKP